MLGCEDRRRRRMQNAAEIMYCSSIVSFRAETMASRRKQLVMELAFSVRRGLTPTSATTSLDCSLVQYHENVESENRRVSPECKDSRLMTDHHGFNRVVASTSQV